MKLDFFKPITDIFKNFKTFFIFVLYSGLSLFATISEGHLENYAEVHKNTNLPPIFWWGSLLSFIASMIVTGFWLKYTHNEIKDTEQKIPLFWGKHIDFSKKGLVCH